MDGQDYLYLDITLLLPLMIKMRFLKDPENVE